MSLYPINQLVKEAAKAERETLEKLGYKNFNKGKRQLDAILASNTVDRKHRTFRDKFFHVFEVSTDAVTAAREETTRTLRAAAEKYQQSKSMPLRMEFEKKPSGMHGYMADHALSRLKEFEPAQPESLVAEVAALIQDHQKALRENPLPQGAIRAYWLHVSDFESWVFDLEGNLTQKQQFLPAHVDF